MPTIIISPCAKLTTRMTPKITDRPSAISPYTMPVSKPLLTAWASERRKSEVKSASYPEVVIHLPPFAKQGEVSPSARFSNGVRKRVGDGGVMSHGRRMATHDPSAPL